MRTWKRKFCEVAIVLGCLVGVIVIGASDYREKMVAEGDKMIQQEVSELFQTNS